jgi:hypothetical protein
MHPLENFARDLHRASDRTREGVFTAEHSAMEVFTSVALDAKALQTNRSQRPALLDRLPLAPV